jgi:hypothetical protein
MQMGIDAPMRDLEQAIMKKYVRFSFRGGNG